MQNRSKQTLYFDVTQLVHWQGKLTGIPRVINELAIRLVADDARKVVFVSWVKEAGCFCEIDFAYTMAHRSEGIAYLPAADGAVAVAVTTPVSSLRKQLKRVAKGGLRRASRLHPRLAEKAASRLQAVQTRNYRQIQTSKSDVVYVPWGEWWDDDFTQYLVSLHGHGAQLVQFIHDIAPTTQPQFFEQMKISPTVYNSKILPIAAQVHTNSANSKRELEDWLRSEKLHVPSISVVRLGDNLEVGRSKQPTDERFVAAGLKGDDFKLTVGTIEAKKNHYLLYYVYKLAKARGIVLPKMVIVGRLGWHTQEMYDIMTQDPEVKDSLVFLHNASDEELAWLYDNCLFTVQPSWHEGWGIPIAESVGRGVPCLCSNTSSMVEIAEGIVDHFSPASADECLAGMQKFSDKQYLAAARKRAKSYAPHTWEASYAQVNAALEEIEK